MEFSRLFRCIQRSEELSGVLGVPQIQEGYRWQHLRMVAVLKGSPRYTEQSASKRSPTLSIGIDLIEQIILTKKALESE